MPDVHLILHGIEKQAKRYNTMWSNVIAKNWDIDGDSYWQRMRTSYSMVAGQDLPLSTKLSKSTWTRHERLGVDS